MKIKSIVEIFKKMAQSTVKHNITTLDFQKRIR